MADLSIVKAGFHTTIQDSGRTAFRNTGVPHSGAMDQEAMRYANERLGNTWDAPVLEMTLTGVTCLFTEPAYIVISGATALVMLNENVVKQHEILKIETGDLLSIGALTKGNFCYLAIQGGFCVNRVLGSSSFYKGVTDQYNIKEADVLHYESVLLPTLPKNGFYKIRYTSLKAHAGPAFNLLTSIQQEELLTTVFTVSKNWGRMAFQLTEIIKNDLKAINSTPVLPGTVQLTPAGTLIVLMRDAQTTGGYPCVLQLTETAINQLAQTRVGQTVRFVVI